MKLSVIRKFLMLTICLMIPGCGRIVDWAKGHFPSGTKLVVDKELVLSFVRSTRFYWQWMTTGLFEVLWLSDKVRMAYVAAHAQKVGLSVEDVDALIKCELSKNDHYISFYVLCSLPDTASFGKSNSTWSITLDHNGRRYSPSCVRSVDLPPEYLMFLSKLISMHKKVYVVTFDRWDEQGNDLLVMTNDVLRLIISSANRSTSLEWSLKQ